MDSGLLGACCVAPSPSPSPMQSPRGQKSNTPPSQHGKLLPLYFCLKSYLSTIIIVIIIITIIIIVFNPYHTTLARRVTRARANSIDFQRRTRSGSFSSDNAAVGGTHRSHAPSFRRADLLDDAVARVPDHHRRHNALYVEPARHYLNPLVGGRSGARAHFERVRCCCVLLFFRSNCFDSNKLFRINRHCSF